MKKDELTLLLCGVQHNAQCGYLCVTDGQRQHPPPGETAILRPVDTVLGHIPALRRQSPRTLCGMHRPRGKAALECDQAHLVLPKIAFQALVCTRTSAEIRIVSERSAAGDAASPRTFI